MNKLYRFILTACVCNDNISTLERLYIKRIAEYLWLSGYKAEEWEIILQAIFDGPDYIEQAVREWGIRQ